MARNVFNRLVLRFSLFSGVIGHEKVMMGLTWRLLSFQAQDAQDAASTACASSTSIFEYTATSGYVESLGYPDTYYLSNEYCQWYINPTGGIPQGQVMFLGNVSDKIKRVFFSHWSIHLVVHLHREQKMQETSERTNIYEDTKSLPSTAKKLNWINKTDWHFNVPMHIEQRLTCWNFHRAFRPTPNVFALGKVSFGLWCAKSLARRGTLNSDLQKLYLEIEFFHLESCCDYLKAYVGRGKCATAGCQTASPNMHAEVYFAAKFYSCIKKLTFFREIRGLHTNSLSLLETKKTCIHDASCECFT